MPIPGTFGGFPFDPEVYQGFVDQEATFSDSILASGILASDQSLAASLDNGGTMGTIRFYNPLDPDTDEMCIRDRLYADRLRAAEPEVLHHGV